MPARVAFVTESEDAAEQFVREYVLDAVDRAPEIEGCEGLAFGLNEAPDPDGGSVAMTVFGEAEEFLREEEATWEEYRAAGGIRDWSVERIPREYMEETFGEKGAALTERLMPLADRMARLVYDEFDDLDDLPAAHDTYDDEDTRAGWWIVPHHIAFASLDYSATEEIAVHKAGIEEDLRIIAERDEAAADARLDSLLADLEAMREDVKAGRAGSRGG